MVRTRVDSARARWTPRPGRVRDRSTGFAPPTEAARPIGKQQAAPTSGAAIPSVTPGTGAIGTREAGH
jgi:hypothetical protein